MYGILESEKFMLVESEIWESFVCGIWNLGLWNPEYNTRNPASPLTIGMQNPSSTHKDWNPYLESGIHGKESRIQDYFGFRYLGRQPDAQFWIKLGDTTPTSSEIRDYFSSPVNKTDSYR